MSDAKPVQLPSHLWSTLEQMGSEMGLSRDQLIAQSVFTLARLNGYLIPGKVQVGAGSAPRLEPSRGPVSRASPGVSGARRPSYDDPLDSSGDADDSLPSDDAGNEDEGMEDDLPDQDVSDAAPAPRGGSRVHLKVMVPGREPFKLLTDSMTIGRGKSCDFVIESNRVSREHARITREGSEFYFEDLNSSNGSFYGPAKEKVTTRRKLKDGDEFTLGTEKVRFSIRR